MHNYQSIEFLIGKVLETVSVNNDQDVVRFEATDGSIYEMYHYQNCCESVYLEDVTGELEDLIGTPILAATESSNQDYGVHGDSVTWTFYTFRTIKGTVTMRWYGSSNGYYSESVDFCQVRASDKEEKAANSKALKNYFELQSQLEVVANTDEAARLQLSQKIILEDLVGYDREVYVQMDGSTYKVTQEKVEKITTLN